MTQIFLLIPILNSPINIPIELFQEPFSMSNFHSLRFPKPFSLRKEVHQFIDRRIAFSIWGTLFYEAFSFQSERYSTTKKSDFTLHLSLSKFCLSFGSGCGCTFWTKSVGGRRFGFYNNCIAQGGTVNRSLSITSISYSEISSSSTHSA